MALIREDAATGVLVWWAALAATGVLGVGLWAHTAIRFKHTERALDPLLRDTRARQLVLSAVYAFGCAFRAMLPRADVQRICLLDSWLSSVLLGRTVATIAELCFAAQWALMLREASLREHGVFAAWTARSILPLIAVAEVSSWYAVITTNFVGNVIEQSLWTLTVALMTLSLAVLAPRYEGRLRTLVLAWIACGVLFVAFVSMIDVPMYYSRVRADEASHTRYLGFSEGLADLASRWIVTHAWQAWKDEIAWMSLYFSAAVWLSISLVRAPWLGPTSEPTKL